MATIEAEKAEKRFVLPEELGTGSGQARSGEDASKGVQLDDLLASEQTSRATVEALLEPTFTSLLADNEPTKKIIIDVAVDCCENFSPAYEGLQYLNALLEVDHRFVHMLCNYEDMPEVQKALLEDIIGSDLLPGWEFGSYDDVAKALRKETKAKKARDKVVKIFGHVDTWTTIGKYYHNLTTTRFDDYLKADGLTRLLLDVVHESHDISRTLRLIEVLDQENVVELVVLDPEASREVLNLLIAAPRIATMLLIKLNGGLGADVGLIRDIKKSEFLHAIKRIDIASQMQFYEGIDAKVKAIEEIVNEYGKLGIKARISNFLRKL